MAGSSFIQGLFMGFASSFLFGLGTLYLLLTQEVLDLSQVGLPVTQAIVDWLYRNLGLSLIPFLFILLFYTGTLRRLARRVGTNSPVEQVIQLEHLTDIWISLFFGVGVIWTAIGMRTALLYALGDMEEAGRDAFSVLERLVDGGILTALSTTILGGVGGYLMRLGKTFYVGAKLNHYYSHQEQDRSGRIEGLLNDIRDKGFPPHTSGEVAEEGKP